MKTVIHNEDNLTDKDIDKVIIRIKALLINGNYIYVANANNTYHFPGGHLEKNESFEDCLKREVKEETGITINDNMIGKPIMLSTLYWKSSEKNNNRKCDTYYYVIPINEEPDITKASLTKDEIDGGFKILKISLDEIIDILIDNIPNNYMNSLITPDMIEAIKEYKDSL